jgi:hypothetical protein
MVWSDDGDGDGLDSIASVAVSVSRARVYLYSHLDVECFLVFGVNGGESLAISDVATFIHRRAQTPRAVVLLVSSPFQRSSSLAVDKGLCVNGRGTFPMGLSTIVGMLSYVAVPKWGVPMLLFTEILFWINAALSFLICFGVLTSMSPPPPSPPPDEVVLTFLG